MIQTLTDMWSQLMSPVPDRAPAGAKRHKNWSKVRDEFIAKNPICSVCGGKEKLVAHHKIPFHIDPSRELDPENLITLCEAEKFGVHCHLFFGHFGNWQKFNDAVVYDAITWRLKLSGQFRAMSESEVIRGR